jgi:hypothetical protein
VGLVVVDEAGLTATDEVDIVVSGSSREPPTCQAFVGSTEGAVPFATVLRSTFDQPRGRITSISWTLWDGSTRLTTDVPVELTSPGQYTAYLRVEDDLGLTCSDSVTLVVFGQGASPEGERVPPRLLYVPRVEAECGVPAVYDEGGLPLVSGMGPFTFTAEPLAGESLPEGFQIDSTTGRLLWTPGHSSTGEGRFLLRVMAPGGTDVRAVDLTVRCGGPINLGVGCGCSSGVDALSSSLVLAALVWLARRRSKWEARRFHGDRRMARCRDPDRNILALMGR